jgi:ABC-type phosphate/phosphonate transport system substrate-binding protein
MSSVARFAALPMYDFPELTDATDALWSFLAERLRYAGLADVPSALDRSLAYDQTWTAPGLLLSQSCGLPIVSQLDGLVTVLGSFAVATGTADARYCTKLVVHADSPVSALGELPWNSGVTVSINGCDSLSGFVSLGAACAAAETDGLIPVGSAFASIRVSGGHAFSAADVSSGVTQLASLDGHSFDLLRHHRPAAVERVKVIHEGPIVPCLPFITPVTTDAHTVALLRDALTAAATDPALDAVRSALRITGFVRFDADRYEPIRELHRRATDFFARTQPDRPSTQPFPEPQV